MKDKILAVLMSLYDATKDAVIVTLLFAWFLTIPYYFFHVGGNFIEWVVLIVYITTMSKMLRFLGKLLIRITDEEEKDGNPKF